MRKYIQTLGFLFLLTLFSTSSIANTPHNNFPYVKTLRTEIISLIKKPDLSSLNTQKEVVKLSFLVNQKKEVVVIHADTPSQYLEDYIKHKLNYQKIKTDYVKFNKIYHIKLVFKKNK
jgi:hypothetical protein